MDAIIAATRLTVWVLLIGNAAILAHYIRRRRADAGSIGREPAITAATAILLQTVGWASHQAYWWHWQMARVSGHAAIEAGLEAYQSLTLVCYGLIIAGAALLSSLYVRVVVQSVPWPVSTGGATAAIWIIGYQAATVMP